MMMGGMFMRAVGSADPMNFSVSMRMGGTWSRYSSSHCSGWVEESTNTVPDAVSSSANRRASTVKAVVLPAAAIFGISIVTNEINPTSRPCFWCNVPLQEYPSRMTVISSEYKGWNEAFLNSSC